MDPTYEDLDDLIEQRADVIAQLDDIDDEDLDDLIDARDDLLDQLDDIEDAIEDVLQDRGGRDDDD
jgi:hypothetical protein